MNRRSSTIPTRRVVNRTAPVLLGLLACLAGFAFERDKGPGEMTASADELVTTSQNPAPEPTAPQPPMPEPRDPEIAVREQYDAAVAAGTIAALDLFIERYPGHPLAAAAEEEIRRMRAAGKTR
jgi:hypothetical protein